MQEIRETIYGQVLLCVKMDGVYRLWIFGSDMYIVSLDLLKDLANQFVYSIKLLLSDIHTLDTGRALKFGGLTIYNRQNDYAISSEVVPKDQINAAIARIEATMSRFLSRLDATPL